MGERERERGLIPLLLENLPNWKEIEGKVEDYIEHYTSL